MKKILTAFAAALIAWGACAEKYSADLLSRAQNGDDSAQYWLGMAYYNGDGVPKDYNLAAEWMKKSADADNAGALNWMSTFYQNGTGVPKDPVKATECLERSAKQGNPWALRGLGHACLMGNGMDKNLRRGFKCYMQASAKDNESWRWLGYCHEHGYGTRRDYSSAAEAYDKGARKGTEKEKQAQADFIGRLEKLADTDCEAARALAISYANGWGVAKDDGKKFSYALKGAEGGDPQSMAIAGDCYMTGTGTAVNYTKALEMLRKAADAGFTSANFSLGLMYEQGKGVPASETEAIKYYGRAARMGNAGAMNNLGSLYWNAKGNLKNPFKALVNFEAAAAKGDATASENITILAKGLVHRQRNDMERIAAGLMWIGAKEQAKGTKLLVKAAAKEPMALGVLAIVHGNENYGMQNLPKAVDYARQGAAKYDMLSIATLGVMYYNGIGVPVDYYKAAEYWTQASSMGDVESTYNLGLLYLNGEGVQANPQKALELLTQAMDEEMPEALLALAHQSYNGEGLPRDYDLAFRLLKRCSENGYLFSNNVYAGIARNLSACYRFGRGTAQDEVLADYWLEIANENGNEDAAGMQVKFNPIVGSII